MYLNKINSPEDLKKIPLEELPLVAQEIRDGVLNRVSTHGGHVGPNLGFVEATIALHYVFYAPTDKFVFDISHQSYPHKMLTGRAFGFTGDADTNAVSGYSSPTECPEYDNFEIGHTSTSISLATGLQKARDIKGEQHNVVAIIGDGSLSGGEAFEGFDTAAELGTNIIIVVNDNDMSIAENHGGLYRNLAELRQTKGHAKDNFFKAMGFDYIYEDHGHDINRLIELFREVKDIDHPVVIHLHTEKGHGYQPAVADKETWHWHSPFDIATGADRHPGDDSLDIETLLGKWLTEQMAKYPHIVAVTSGVPAGLGFGPQERKALGKQFVDVGIAEEQGVAMASGMAKGGIKPVYYTYATFLQRTYDQLAQDLAVNQNPAVINVLGSSIFGMNDITHVCFFDIAMLSHIPGLVYLAPTSYNELIAMEQWAINQQNYPVAIRVPVGDADPTDDRTYDTDYSQLNKFRITHQGDTVAIIAAGNFYNKGLKVAELLKNRGIEATVINPRFISGIDTDMLADLKSNHKLVVTLEDGVLDGGFGERIARYYGPTDVRVLCFGVEKKLYDRYKIEQLLTDNHLHDEQIVEKILQQL